VTRLPDQFLAFRSAIDLLNRRNFRGSEIAYTLNSCMIPLPAGDKAAATILASSSSLTAGKSAGIWRTSTASANLLAAPCRGQTHPLLPGLFGNAWLVGVRKSSHVTGVRRTVAVSKAAVNMQLRSVPYLESFGLRCGGSKFCPLAPGRWTRNVAFLGLRTIWSRQANCVSRCVHGISSSLQQHSWVLQPLIDIFIQQTRLHVP
jgi:hypothetical protein